MGNKNVRARDREEQWKEPICTNPFSLKSPEQGNMIIMVGVNLPHEEWVAT